MKKAIIAIAILSANNLFSQNYGELLDKAGAAIQKKEFCAALPFFKEAFKDTAKISTYDLAYAALSAANCNEEKLALTWLTKSQKMGLGMNPGEADYIANDSGFVKLRPFSEWTAFVAAMRQAVVEKQLADKKKGELWLSEIASNKITARVKGKFKACKSGFALYFSKKDSFDVPYLVYVPKKYDPKKPTKAIVYLHGGIVSTDNFNYQDPNIGMGEPIFSIADTFNTLIIYPFGKKDFGWVKQKAAFENVLTIVENVKSRYNIDPQNIFLGGMSNGGTAAFWFATQKPNIFKAFYAFSALPKLEIGNIAFENMAQGKPFYSLTTKDDDIFKFEEVESIYNQNKAIAKDWQFDTIPTGGHGFIYQQNGRDIMGAFWGKILK